MMKKSMRNINPSISYRLLYPSVPTLIVSSSKNTISAMLAVSVIALSNEPALLGISISPEHSTYKTIKRSKKLTVSLFDSKDIPRLIALSKELGYRTKDKLRASGFHKTITPKLALAAPTEAIAVFECRVINDFETGDHRLLICTIASVYASDDFEDYWKYEQYNPILYGGSSIGFVPYNKSKKGRNM